MKLQFITVNRCSEGYIHILFQDDFGQFHNHQMPLGFLLALAIAKETTVAQPKYAGVLQ